MCDSFLNFPGIIKFRGIFQLFQAVDTLSEYCSINETCGCGTSKKYRISENNAEYYSGRMNSNIDVGTETSLS